MSDKSIVWLAVILCILVFLCIGVLAVPQQDISPTPEQKRLNLESLEYVWKTVYEKHYDSTFGGLNWFALRSEMGPQMERAETQEEARSVLERMIDRLNLSHFNIIPREAYSNFNEPGQSDYLSGSTGIDARFIADQALVIRVDPGSPAEAAGVKAGWEILRIGEKEISSMPARIAKEYPGKSWKDGLLSSVLMGWLRTKVGGQIAVEFRGTDNQKVVLTLKLTEPRGKKVRFGDLSAYVWIDTCPITKGIGYIAFNAFLEPGYVMPLFNESMKSFMDYSGIILDLRGNNGGIGTIAVGMGGWFVKEEQQSLGTLYMRDAQMKIIIRPRPETYNGPLAILVDEMSVSAAEFLSGGLQDLGRARIFGTRTPGIVLPSIIERLPNGDGFQYAFGHYISSSGRVLEGKGVLPDFKVVHTRETLLQGKDSVLDAAVDWIQSQTNNHFIKEKKS